MSFIIALVVTIIVVMVSYGSMKPVSQASNANEYMDNEINLTLKTDNFLRTEKKKKKDD